MTKAAFDKIARTLREQAYVCQIAGLLENARLFRAAADALDAAQAEIERLRAEDDEAGREQEDWRMQARNKIAELEAELARLRGEEPAGDMALVKRRLDLIEALITAARSYTNECIGHEFALTAHPLCETCEDNLHIAVAALDAFEANPTP